MKAATSQEREVDAAPRATVAQNYSVDVEALVERLAGATITDQEENRNPLVFSEKSYPETVNTSSPPEPFLKIQYGTEVCR